MSGYLNFLRERAPAPVLVLGLGNTLLSDDGVGPALLDCLSSSAQRWEGQVEFVDGGTQGLALLGCLSGRKALIIVDAVKTGAPPGTVHRMTLGELRSANPGRAGSAHEGNAGELLAAAQLVDELPDRLFVVGVEPKKIATGYGLSAPVKRALPEASKEVNQLLTQLC
ncbi:MAG TPA: hydrogenase maturation protease [Candidatus Acidoferrum sp.]|nr:hydrogenase maturation protease [Candidatus Acidoferrum sp.]